MLTLTQDKETKANKMLIITQDKQFTNTTPLPCEWEREYSSEVEPIKVNKGEQNCTL